MDSKFQSKTLNQHTLNQKIQNQEMPNAKLDFWFEKKGFHEATHWIWIDNWI
jgi:hypothetical protein